MPINKERLLGPYLLLERLGEGANGQVFKARYQAMNRILALKVLRKDLLADDDAAARFYRNPDRRVAFLASRSLRLLTASQITQPISFLPAWAHPSPRRQRFGGEGDRTFRV